MKYNIQPDMCDFFVNKEKRTTVCVLKNTKNLFIKFAEENFKLPYISWKGDSINKLYKKLYMPDRFIGTSVCSEEDEFNEDIGRFIAFSRLKDKVNQSFFKKANLYIQTFDNWVSEATEQLNKLGNKLTVNTEHREKQINKMVGRKSEEV